MLFFLFPLFILFFYGFPLTIFLSVLAFLGHVITLSTVAWSTLVYGVALIIILKVSLISVLYWNEVRKFRPTSKNEEEYTKIKSTYPYKVNLYFARSHCLNVPLFTSFFKREIHVMLDKLILSNLDVGSAVEDLGDELKRIVCHRNLRLRQLALCFVALYLLPFWCMEAVIPKKIFQYFIPICISPVALFYVLLRRQLPLLNTDLLASTECQMVRKFYILREGIDHIYFDQSLFDHFIQGIALFPNYDIRALNTYHYQDLIHE